MNALLISIRMYSEVFASVSAAGATGLCSSSFALTGSVAACYGHNKRKARRSSPCTTTLAGELFFRKLQRLVMQLQR